eukprot:IDg4657t1
MHFNRAAWCGVRKLPEMSVQQTRFEQQTCATAVTILAAKRCGRHLVRANSGQGPFLPRLPAHRCCVPTHDISDGLLFEYSVSTLAVESSLGWRCNN